METIDSFTESQLLALTDEDLEKYIALQCAVEGVALLPERPVCPEPYVVKPDVETFEVCGIAFMNKADADEVAALVNSKPRAEFGYDRHYSTFFKGVTYEDKATVAPKGQLSQQMRDQHSIRIAEAAESKKRYEAAIKEYSHIADARDEIAGKIRETVGMARARQREREDYRAKFQRYVEIAEGNAHMALQFFDRAYPQAFSRYPELRDEFTPPQPDALAA